MAENIEEHVQTTVDGVRAVEMRYRAVRRTDSGDVAFYQTTMRLNSPSMGTLTPDRFLPVLERTDQCVSVFRLAMIQVVQAAAKFSGRELEFGWISLYMPLRLLKKNDCVKIVSQIADKYKTPPEKLCFELPLSAFDENDGMCARNVGELRRLGYHIMVTGIGAEGFSLVKLAACDFDYAMLDGSVVQMYGDGERAEICVRSLISLVNDLGAEPIASGVISEAQTEKLYNYECSFYTGAYAGHYMLERFVRRKSAE